MSWGRILTSAPVNAQAARVTARGTHWEPENLSLPAGYVRSETPLPTRPWPATALGQDNLTGRRVGRVTVLGLAAEKRAGKSGARWVVRCACGTYEHRTTKALRNPHYPARVMCARCDHVEQIMLGNVR